MIRLPLPPRLRLAGLLGATLWLAACSSPFPSQEQTRVYELSPTTSAAVSDAAPAEPLALTLRLDTPGANSTLNSTRILVKPDASRVNVYPGGRWSDNAPALVREHLIETLRQSGAFKAVLSERSGARTDLILASDLRAFNGEYRNGATEVLIVLEAQLIQSSTQQVLATERFDVRQPSRSNSLEDVVHAFGEAGQALSARVIEWSRGVAEAPGPSQ